MSSTPRITPQTAPRTLEGLQAMGVFQIRLLLEELGCLATDENKQAFAKMKAEDKAATALQWLQHWDQQNPGQYQGVPATTAPAMAPPPPQTNGATNGTNGAALPVMAAPVMGAPPMAGPPMNGTPVMQQQMPFAQPQVAAVNPGALASAASAAAGGLTPPTTTTTTTKGRRQPASNGANGDADLANTVLNSLSTLLTETKSQNEAITGALREVAQKLDKGGNAELSADVKSILQQYQGIYQVMTNFNASLSALQASTGLSISLSLFLAENVLGAGRDEILKMALADVGSVQNMVQTTSAGKA